MPQGGKLRIKTSSTKNQVSLLVEDTGMGISKENLSQIFLPFFTTKDVDEGTGSGLSVVHGIVLSHKGEIQVKSDEGKGTRFEIKLPIHSGENNGDH
jgi:signal transduction histidine kinase